MCAIAATTPPGAFVEVGVYHGGTAYFLAQAAASQLRPLYLYDTFRGIPYADPSVDNHLVGDFSDTSLEFVRESVPYAICIPGVFPGSAVEMGPIAFVHLDCDQYRSYCDALAYLDPLMVKGGVIWCDDADCLAGAGKAVREYCDARARPLIRAEKMYIQF